ncbi:MAG: anthranilate synthase component 1 [Deltaproteobacteria bacterium]|nr:anthranilate synthase component 1 [Deltaproteobacteria bacterium]MBN2672551.1 anthranilate synthase component 1 [Deltaproteobacteria bacterium]
MQAYTVLKQCRFSSDPFTIFSALCKDGDNTVLLESKDGNGKNNVASMLFVENALCVEAKGTTVTIKVLTPNGENALSAVTDALASLAPMKSIEGGIEMTFSGKRPSGDDLTRIKAVYPSEVLRVLSRKWNLGTDDKQRRLSLPGIFSYDHLEHFEALPAAKHDTLGFADFIFYLPEVAVKVDHEKNAAYVLVHGYNATSYDAQYSADVARAEAIARQVEAVTEGTVYNLDKLSGHAVSSDAETDLSDEEYAALVKKLQHHIVIGDVFQIVPSRTFSADCDDPLTTYGVLRQLNPSPYLFYLKHGEFTLFGSSPETSVKVEGNPLVASIRPIAGTRRRGRKKDGTIDKDMDGRLEAELKLNEKELAEHMMLVDLARNDVARVSKPGSRFVSRLLVAERYSHVMHLVSIVEGELRDDLDALHAYLASANMGTLVGSPKIEAAKLLRLNENTKRGPYGGAIGYLTSDGEMDTAIVIRSALVKGQTAYVRAGAGVVFDSDPMAEAHETRAKASAVLKAIALAKEVK